MLYRTKLQEKLDEALSAVLPIMILVLLLSLTVAPIPSGILLAFMLGGVLLVVGMMFFTLGAELAMQPIGEQVGVTITKTRNLWIILPTGFLLGMLITISEPDLQVLAGQVQAIPRYVLIFSVAGGVGLFLVVALVRILFGIKLRTVLLLLYSVVLIVALFAPSSFLAVAFDSGGVTTGPMTVPFILSFGVGISAIRSDQKAQGDSFGLISLCSVGPILAVLVLSLIYRTDDANYIVSDVQNSEHSIELSLSFVKALPTYLFEIARAILPIVAFFALFQITSLHLGKKQLTRISIGLLYTYLGLVIFLTGVNVGFMPAGTYLGKTLAGQSARWIIIPIGMVIGYFIVKAEPAVYVLMKQVEEMTNGAISGATLQRSLSIGVAVSVGLAMIRVLSGISILYLIIPGYLLALTLSFFVPDIFTAIAFDSGGVASGPMTATFLLPFATGATLAVGGNIATDAFGVVAMVSMTPLIAIQILGVVYRVNSEKAQVASSEKTSIEEKLDWLDDYEIIAL